MRPVTVPSAIRSPRRRGAPSATLALALGGALLLGQGAALAAPLVAPEEGGHRGATERFRTLVNAAPIVGPEAGPSSPYPSKIEVSGMTGTILDVDLLLNGLEGDSPADLDIILVGPDGDAALVMSDAGGNGGGRVNLVLDDEAANPLPDATAPLASGFFRPANFEEDEPFPPPAPRFESNPVLTQFDGTDPNGTWRLFVVDDNDCCGSSAFIPDAGSIANGWRLEITHDGLPPTAKDDRFQAKAGKTLRRDAPGVLANDADPDSNDDLAARLVTRPRHGKLALKPDGGFAYTPGELTDRARVTIKVKG